MTEATEPLTLCDRMAFIGLGVIDQFVTSAREQLARGELLEGLPDPLMLIGPAARGDHVAQRDLALMAGLYIHDRVQSAGVGEDETAVLAEGIMFGRLAAAHGGDDDEVRLAVLLAMGATFSWNPRERVEWAAECVARLELLGDAGNEQAAELLAAFADRESAEVLEEAQAIRARLLAIKEAN